MGINYSPKIVTDGLVLYLDAANKKSYPGTGNTWYDLSGYGNHGTLNGVTYSSNGYFIFDGLDDYVNGNLIQGLGSSITIEIGINLITSMASRIFFGIDTDSHTSLGVFLNSTATIWYWNTGDSYNTPFNTSPQLSLNNWYNIIISTNQSDNNAKLYTDGIYTGVANYKNPTTTGTGDKYQIGRYFNNVYWANVKYSFFKVYNRALSATEIKQNFNATRGRYGI